MEPRYFIKEEKGAFFIYPSDGKEWVAACIDKEEAEKLCAEKNKKMQEETPYKAVFRGENGKPIECKLHIEHVNLADVKAFEPPQEKPEKPKKKSIPRVLRPTVTMPEQDWQLIVRCVRRVVFERAEDMASCCDRGDARLLAKRASKINKIFRLVDHIEGEINRFCAQYRDVDDIEAVPF